MTTFTKTTFAALALMGSVSVVQAGNAGDSLDDCLLHIANACTESDHPGACLSAGEAACVEYHEQQASQSGPQIDKILIQQRPNGTYRVVLNDTRPRPQSQEHENRDPEPNRSRDEDRGGSSSGGSGRGDRPGR